MGNLPLNGRNKKFKQGIFRPKNKEKLISSDGYAIYRSGLELEYFRMLDENSKIKRWGSEEIYIPYQFNNGWHKYYIDLFVEMTDGKRLFIEIKPWKQTQEPKWNNRRKKETYLRECAEYSKNIAKWKSAVEYSKKYNIEFKILTEKDIRI